MHVYLDKTAAFPACRFAWKSSFMGEVEYTVTDETGTFLATLRHTLGDYERSILNPHAGAGDVVPYADQVASEIGILRRCVCDNAGEILPSTIAAFNHWCAIEHARAIAYMEANPHRFGDVSDMEAPAPITGGRWTRGHGWTAVEPSPAAVDSAIRANPALIGRAAYEASVAAAPAYHDGTPRKPWAKLGAIERDSWCRAPRAEMGA